MEDLGPAPLVFMKPDVPIKSELEIVPNGGFSVRFTTPAPNHFHRWVVRWLLGWKWREVKE